MSDGDARSRSIGLAAGLSVAIVVVAALLIRFVNVSVDTGARDAVVQACMRGNVQRAVFQTAAARPDARRLAAALEPLLRCHATIDAQGDARPMRPQEAARYRRIVASCRLPVLDDHDRIAAARAAPDQAACP